MQDSGSLAVFKVTARDQGHYKGPSGAFVTYCNISCFRVAFTDRNGIFKLKTIKIIYFMEKNKSRSFGVPEAEKKEFCFVETQAKE